MGVKTPKDIKKILKECKNGSMIVNYGHKMSYLDISKEMGIDTSQVKALETRALYKLHKALKENPKLKEILNEHLLMIAGGQGEY